MQFSWITVFLLDLIVYNKKITAIESVDLRKTFFHPPDDLPPSCHSKIYCNSEFLHDVQMSRAISLETPLVKKKLKFTESEILAKYNQMKLKYYNSVPPNAELLKFVEDNFEEGNELMNWIPTDFTENPSIVDRIEDENYKQWAKALNHEWKNLAKKINDDVKVQPDKYSLLWVPNGFMIAGGKFKELYYWDTYWIINGLLLCDMRTTARGIIENIISLVKKFGFMPNGSRVYYLNRSQPPMLILMVLSYYKATYDFNFIETVITILEIEFQFWLDNRMVTFEKDGKTYTMATYNAQSRGPRPESYWNDYKLAEKYHTEKEKNDIYSKIKSATESGWDFSSRWYITANGTSYGNLSDIQTSNIVPVDLNSILHINAHTLSTWFNRMGNEVKANKYREIAAQFLKNIHDVMWKSDKGVWFDWDLLNNKHREYFYISNIMPLWTGSYTMPKKYVANAVLGYLCDQHIIEIGDSIKYYGTPTSMYSSSQQWDFPNAWPPLQAFLIQGLYRTQQKLAQKAAKKLADVWLRSNYKGYATKSLMFEKYNAQEEGITGGGGEYIAQSGFGWTNGVVFEFLDQWGNLASNTTDN